MAENNIQQWIEERRAIQSMARPFTEEDPDDFEKPSIFSESVDRERVEANIAASNDGLLHFPRALDALQAVLEQVDRMEADANTYGDEGHDLPCDALFAYAGTLREAIEGAIND